MAPVQKDFSIIQTTKKNSKGMKSRILKQLFSINLECNKCRTVSIKRPYVCTYKSNYNHILNRYMENNYHSRSASLEDHMVYITILCALY